ncbi:TPA: DNA circularization N-terminal domain-containing protein [Pseudomonas putida]|uniref:DNA circularization protein n=1 Tax=Pseudomonas putida TaxID=303 RepID=UPI0023635977|nr:DNA circularization N-terminal domain-containing protein [Pseudomonas putida]MDD2150738.1 DNA circularization N-terminal domain-containing protein [Pseudomonas putida]HDS1679150.1 DNA circularization N-terminal domain-containing protein [Pseudomonas putida]
MTTWRDELHPASFRGVPFHVDSDSMPVGRRTQVHEYPQRDKPLVEDLGRVTREIKMAAFVIGEDFLIKRDDLLNALDKPGAGELIHPWYGRLMVTATGCSVGHERREGGMARFDLVFVEDGEKGFPAGVPNTARQLEESSETLLQSAIRRYKAAMAVVNRARLAVVVLQNGIAGVQMAIAQELRQLTGLVSSVEALADMLINAPGNFSAMIRGQFSSVGGSRSTGYRWGPSSSTSSTASASSSASSIEADPEFASTVAGLPEADPEFVSFAASSRAIATQVEQSRDLAAQVMAAASAIEAGSTAAGGAATAAVIEAARELVRDALIVLAVRTAAAMPVVQAPAPLSGYPSLQQQVASPIARPDVPVTADVVAVRDAIEAALVAAEQTAPHEHFEVLEVVRKQVRAHLTEVARAGVRLAEVTTLESLPAVVLAYQRYGDATRAAEIVTRNKVAHPGFLPVGVLAVAQE